MQSIQNTNYTNSWRFKKVALIVYGSLATLFLCVFTYDILIGFKKSSFLSLSLVVAVIVSGYFYVYKQKYLLAIYILFFMQLLVLILATRVEGIMSGNHMYFFTMVYSIPFIIKRSKKFNIHIKIFYISTFVSIIIAGVLSPGYSDIFPESQTNLIYGKLILNTLINFLIIIVFSLVSIRTSDKLLNKINKQKQIAENEKDSRTRVILNLGHELRTQVNSINGITKLILGDSEIKNHEKNYTRILDHCNSNMLSLVNDMLDLHKIEEGEFELFLESKNIFDIASKATIPFENQVIEKNLTLITNLDTKLKNKYVRVDDMRLTQVLQNLISNAVKYTTEGSITFSAELKEATPEKVTVHFSIKDTGIGIKSSNLQKIFESFQQIKREEKPIYGGTGLGLAISKTIVSKMKSEIHVESIVDEGSEFYFDIEFERVLETKKEEKLITEDVNFLDNKNVLIVEDNTISMMYADKLLQKYGAKTHQAVNGLEAVNMVKTHARELDLVLLDLEMPKMNGFEAITHIKNYSPDLTVIAFTANVPEQSLLSKLDELKFNDIISKPFKKEDIKQVLHRALNNVSNAKYKAN